MQNSTLIPCLVNVTMANSFTKSAGVRESWLNMALILVVIGGLKGIQRMSKLVSVPESMLEMFDISLVSDAEPAGS